MGRSPACHLTLHTCCHCYIRLFEQVVGVQGCVRLPITTYAVKHFYPSLARNLVPPGKKRKSLLTSYSLFCLPLLSWPDCLAQCLQKGAKLYIPSPKNKRGTAAQLLLLRRSPGRVHFQASSYSNYKVALHSQEPRKMLSLHVVKKNL